MPKQAISVTLAADNLVWLKGRLGQSGARSISELLDRLVTAARRGGGADPARTVVGTVDIAASDPLLETADAAVRRLFEVSLRRPMLVRERRSAYTSRSAKRRRG